MRVSAMRHETKSYLLHIYPHPHRYASTCTRQGGARAAAKSHKGVRTELQGGVCSGPISETVQVIWEERSTEPQTRCMLMQGSCSNPASTLFCNNTASFRQLLSYGMAREREIIHSRISNEGANTVWQFQAPQPSGESAARGQVQTARDQPKGGGRGRLRVVQSNGRNCNTRRK